MLTDGTALAWDAAMFNTGSLGLETSAVSSLCDNLEWTVFACTLGSLCLLMARAQGLSMSWPCPRSWPSHKEQRLGDSC